MGPMIRAGTSLLFAAVLLFGFATGIAPPVFAQDAKVVLLELPDSKRAAVAYANLQKAQAAYDAIRQEISMKYMTTPEPHNHGAQAIAAKLSDRTVYWREGWCGGFRFSTDFKAIVPDASGTAIIATTWGSITSESTPANGTATTAPLIATVRRE